jgi:SAM-dependent methyltransferase
MSEERDYVLGTHDEEIARLALQHSVWRARALEGWRRAGFTVGQKLLDIGCGPGYATLDLAEITGPSGEVIAVDRSRRFLDTLEGNAQRRGISNVRAIEMDLDVDRFSAAEVDGAWARWVFAFVKNPRQLLERVRETIKPGGVLVLHEYFHYATWQLIPRSSDFEEFVRTVMKAWRESGGEPDIALDLTVWLGELGFEIKSMLPFVDVVPPSSFVWQWPKAFVETALRRLIHLGHLSAERARVIADAFAAAEASPRSLVITPGVLEIIAIRS